MVGQCQLISFTKFPCMSYLILFSQSLCNIIWYELLTWLPTLNCNGSCWTLVIKNDCTHLLKYSICRQYILVKSSTYVTFIKITFFKVRITNQISLLIFVFFNHFYLLIFSFFRRTLLPLSTVHCPQQTMYKLLCYFFLKHNLLFQDVLFGIVSLIIISVEVTSFWRMICHLAMSAWKKFLV